MTPDAPAGAVLCRVPLATWWDFAAAHPVWALVYLLAVGWSVARIVGALLRPFRRRCEVCERL